MASVGELPLIVIVGPTASGKTAFAIELAERYGGEIICADSRTIYTGMDIGTAKPTPEERARVPHHGLDLVEPGERFTAYDFQQYAYQKIDDIRRRGRIPFLVGGTGLYVDAVVFHYEFPKEVPVSATFEYENMAIDDLREYCVENNINLPINSMNRRHLVSAIMRNNSVLKRRSLPLNDCIVVGISTERSILKQRIIDRAEHLFENGMLDEAIAIGRQYGWGSEAMTGNIYRIAQRVVDEGLDIDTAKQLFIRSDYRLAKRQMTWFKRNVHIRWGASADIRNYIEPLLR